MRARTGASRRLLVLSLLLGLATILLPAPARASSSASLELSPRSGPPTTKVLVTGSGFQADETVDLRLGPRLLAKVRADAQGGFSHPTRVPAGADPGAYRLTATGESSGKEASVAFYVNTNWPQLQFNAARTGLNPYENVLGPSNVAELSETWELPGSYGYNSPVVSSGVLYVTQARPDQLLAISARTGQVLWSEVMGGEYDATGSVPAVAAGVVYAGDVYGLHAFDAKTGAQLWTFSGCGSVWGGGIDVSGETVYIGGTSGLCAVEAKTGEQIWRFLGSGDWNFGAVAVGDGMVFAGAELGAYAVDAKTGAQVWHVGRDKNFYSSVPLVSGGLVYFSAHNSYQSGVVAFRLSTGAMAWQYHQSSDEGNFSGPMALADGRLYVPAVGAVPPWPLYAFKASTGGILWTSPDTSAVGVTAANGVVYAAGESADENALLSALDATDGSILWQASETNARWFFDPVVANGVLYDSAFDLYAFSLPKGPPTGTGG